MQLIIFHYSFLLNAFKKPDHSFLLHIKKEKNIYFPYKKLASYICFFFIAIGCLKTAFRLILEMLSPQQEVFYKCISNKSRKKKSSNPIALEIVCT